MLPLPLPSPPSPVNSATSLDSFAGFHRQYLPCHPLSPRSTDGPFPSSLVKPASRALDKLRPTVILRASKTMDLIQFKV